MALLTSTEYAFRSIVFEREGKMMTWRGREDWRISVQGNGNAKTPVPFGGSGTGFSARFAVSKSESAFLGLRSLNLKSAQDRRGYPNS